MKFDLPTGDSFEIADPGSAANAVEQAAAHPATIKAIEDVAKQSYYCRFEQWRDMDQSTANDIAEALFTQGRDGAESTIADLAGDSNGAAEHFYSHHLNHHSTQALLDALASPVAFEFGIDGEEACDLVREAVKDTIIEKMEEADGSRPGDVVPDHARVECVHFFGADENSSVEDNLLLSFAGRMCGHATVMPDERLARLFEGANVPFEEYRAHILAKTGADLRGGAGNRKLVEWLALGEHRSDSEFARNAAKERATAWKKFKPKHDPARPALMTGERLAQTIEEASYGGIPSFVCRMKLSDIMNHDWTQPLLMTPTPHNGAKSGGFLGIFDPINGSGDIAHVPHPVALAPGRASWRVSGRFGYGVDSVFGIVPHYYYSDPKIDPSRPRVDAAPDPEAETDAAPAPRF